jgi:nucleotide-binding universal stress UspA family protein
LAPWDEDIVFNRVLLCYDGSADGRRALKRGAEFAILVGAEVHVLSILAGNSISPAVLAAAQGHACLVDEEQRCRELLDDCIARLKSRGVKAHAHLARGETIPAIVAYSKKLAADLIVVGHYPNANRLPSKSIAASSSPLVRVLSKLPCGTFINPSPPDNTDTCRALSVAMWPSWLLFRSRIPSSGPLRRSLQTCQSRSKPIPQSHCRPPTRDPRGPSGRYVGSEAN